MPLFKKEEIIGVIKDFFLVRTSIGNSLTLLLVDKEGNIIENFEGNWLLPENWQEENSFWLYQPSQSFSDPTPTMVNILKYNFSTRKREIKSVEIPEYYQYSEFKPTIIGNYFSCLNIQREIFLFEFATGKLTKISTRNHQIISFNLDTTTKKVNIFEMVNGSQDVTVKFYQLPIADEIDFNKYLKWAKKSQDLKVSRFHDTTSPNISFTSSNEFIIKYAKFEDTLTLAAKYNLEGRIISNFRLMETQNLAFITNNIGNDYYQINNIENTWYLTNSGLATIIYQTSGPEKVLNLKNHYLLQSPDDLQTTSNKSFVFSDSANTLRTVNARDLSIQEHPYKIQVAQKSYNITKVQTLADSSYWVYYYSPNGTYIKYNNNDEEVYRTPDSLHILAGTNSFYQLNDTDVLIATYSMGSTDDCNNCIYIINNYLKVDGKNQSILLDTKKFFQGKPIYYYDVVRQHFYVKTDSLIRYTYDFRIDSTFRIKKNIKVGSMLVSKQGNIYLGQTFFSYDIDSLYKLDSKGKVLWRKKYILGESNAYTTIPGGAFYGGLYPIFNKDSIIIWGNLTCGEGCYTSNNIAITENDKLVKLSYLDKLENNSPAYSFINKYGVFMKNYNTFLVYNSTKNSIDKDTNTSIKFTTNYNSIYELDVLPNQDLLVIESNNLKKYSYKKTVWATINNLEKERENYSFGFWTLYAKDAINKSIKLDIFVSDSSQAILKLVPENADVAYINDQTLFFTGKEGTVAVYAQSINGGEPYLSREFTVQKGNPPFSISVEGEVIYPNRPVVVRFESTENISFKIDSVQGSCQLQEGKIVGISPFSENCWVSYSWTGTDIYTSGSSILSVDVLDYLFIADEDIANNTILFPNPLTQYILSIKSPRESIERINITNVQGQKTELVMLQSNFEKGRFVSNFEISKNFSPGTYIIELLDNKGIIIKKEKLIISR
ncbi:hypothetical protein GCM10027442_49750 [Emticicia fontis]